MPWEQLTFTFDQEPEARTQEPEEAPAPRTIPPREPDEFDAWVRRRSEFDRAFMRGMRMSADTRS